MRIPPHSLRILCLVLLLPPARAQGLPLSPVEAVYAAQVEAPQGPSGPVALFGFEGTVENSAAGGLEAIANGAPLFVGGLEGQALRVGEHDPPAFLSLPLNPWHFDSDHDFSVQFWMRSDADSDRRFVVLSLKEFADNSLASQKLPGWVFYVSGGTWAWNMGSGSRRITYERSNGSHMPLNDGTWHQLTITYSSAEATVRLFYDGVNWVSYHVRDSDGFEFESSTPMTVGWDEQKATPTSRVLPAIEDGAERLQRLVDAFGGLGLNELEPEELIHLVVDPRQLFERKVAEAAVLRGADSLAFQEAMGEVDWTPVAEAEAALMSNPYTVHQVLNFMETAPLTRVYELMDGKVRILEDGADAFAERERLQTPDFELDELAIWDRTVSPREVLESYAAYFEPNPNVLQQAVSTLIAADWNIWHGGKHWTVGDHGWDSRVAIAEMLKEEGADVVMMQETYSSGDFIAAELGYYFATTVDWDYLNQGSNISVLSRYPITEVHVQKDSPFQNVGTKIAISDTQDLYVMSNWYGMDQFADVFGFHQSRFAESDSIPTLFAGDFNAVPHTDGGDSPASRALLEAGFTDAFRSLHPDVQEHPGPTHRNGRRIDQLYFKGSGLRNTSTKVISARPSGFPSDHFLILSTFELNYTTRR
jgi:endonuclease/exonuclease/phosphatase family metal-dependent hydrolase